MRVHRTRVTARIMAWATARRSLGLLLLGVALVPCGCTGGRPPAASATLPAHNFGDPAYYVAPPAPAWTPTVARAQRDVNASPQSGKAYYRLGLAYYKQRDYPRAVAALEHARRLAPRQPAPCWWLADAYTAVGQPARALPVLEQLVRMPLQNPQTHSDAWVMLGNCHWDLYQGVEAARAWRESLRYDPHQPSASLGLGLWAAHQHDPGAARSYFEQAVRWAELPRTRAKAHAGLGKLAEEGGDRDGARREYGLALESAAGNAWARAGLERLAARP